MCIRDRCIRVGNRQKKIDISIPKIDTFIHKTYIHIARKVYTNVYLFEKNISPLLVQKNMRELELIIQESILTAIRESIPTEEIIRAYMDESVEQEEEVTIENVEDPVIRGDSEDPEKEVLTPTAEEEEPVAAVPSIKNVDDEPVITRLSFNDYDYVMDEDKNVEKVNAPKTIERLEEISTERAYQRQLEQEEEDDEYRIKIDTSSADIDLGPFDSLDENLLLDDIQELT